VRSELPVERDYGVADGVMLLSSLCAAVALWTYFANTPSAPQWKIYAGIVPTYFFTLAGLTRRTSWANAIRFLIGVWTLTTPFLLGLSTGASALFICLVMGGLLTALSVPEAIRKKAVMLCGRLVSGACSRCRLDMYSSPNEKRSCPPTP
jgi:hypothetical protein